MERTTRRCEVCLQFTRNKIQRSIVIDGERANLRGIAPAIRRVPVSVIQNGVGVVVATFVIDRLDSTMGVELVATNRVGVTSGAAAGQQSKTDERAEEPHDLDMLMTR